MGAIRFTKGALAAWIAKRKYEKQQKQHKKDDKAFDKMVLEQEYDENKSHNKAETATVPVVQSIVSGGAVIGAIKFVRVLYPDKLPWPEDKDVELVTAFMAFVVPMWSYLRTFWVDKEKHGG